MTQGQGSLRTKAARGVFWTAMSHWGNELARLVIFAILARMLEPKDFGLVALALVFMGFTQIIADQGLADAIVQRKDLSPEHLDSAFWMNVGFGVVLAGLLAALSIPISLALGEPRLAPVLAVISLVIPLGSLNVVQRAVLTRGMAFKRLAMRTLISIAVGAIVGIGAALLGFGVWSLVAQQIAGPIAGIVVLWSVAEWRPRFRFSISHFREIFGFGASVVGFRLLNYFTRRSDELFVGAFLGAASLGFYTVGYRMLRLLYQVSSSLVDSVSFPLFSRLQDQPDRLRRAYYKSSSFCALVAFPTFTGALVLAPQVVEVMFGPKWSPSVPIMQVLALFGVVQLLSLLNGTLIKACGKPSWPMAIVAVTAGLKVAGFAIAVRYGITAVAVATLCSGYVVAPVWYWAANRLVPVSLLTYLSNLRGPLLASAAAAATIIGVQHAVGDTHPLVTLVTGVTAGGLVYVAAISLLSQSLAREALGLVRHGLPGAPRLARASGRK